MARHGCVNGTLDDSSYSSLMPIIGLYIAAATLVCFFSILFDVISGFRNRKIWLPCRFFSLNSVTLTLLAIAAKIPVDLTTKMPRVHDQLSKLTGTTLICICMGFLMPSLGINRKSESWSNVLALSIFVVTVVVKICIQLYTGVIVLFRAEHIIMVCCMMLLLLAFFCATYDINSQKGLSTDHNKDLLKKGRGSMLERLKLCYLYAFCSNPQLELCKDMVYSSFTGVISIVSSVVLVQAALRCFIQKEMMFPCNGSSDYEWSAWIIVGTQIATILIGSIGTGFRLVTLAPHMNLEVLGLTRAELDVNVILDNPLLMGSIKSYLLGIAIYLMYVVILLLSIAPCAAVISIWEWCCGFISSKPKEKDMDEIKEYLIHGSDEQGLEEWILRKGVRDMKQWMESKRNNTSNHYMEELLSEGRPIPHSLIDPLKVIANTNKAYEVSSLSVVLLARIATVCLNSALSAPLRTVLGEIFEVIHFVERKMNSSTSFENKEKSKFAKAAFEGPSSRYDLLKVFNISKAKASRLENDIDQVIVVLGRLKDALPSDLVQEELGIIADFIKRLNYGSIQQLDCVITQLFVEMLNEFLMQLPNAIYKEITESCPEDYEKAIRFSLKLLCKVESIEAFVQWSYPIGTSIDKLITDSSNGE